MNAVVVAFDRLPISFLGFHGNAWIDTPNFDRLAAGSAVFEQHYADELAPALFQRGWWSGRVGCREPLTANQSPSLASLLEEQGVAFRLLAEQGCAPELSN